MADQREHEKLEQLREALERLYRRVEALEAKQIDASEPAPAAAVQQKPVPAETQPAPPKISIPRPRKPPPTARWPTPPSRPKRKPLFPQDQSWEKIVGGRGLTWLGAASLALAVAFFLPWAWQHFDMPAWFRVLCFHLAGVGLLAGAWLLNQKKLPVLAQGLAGLGVFTLYASAFVMEHHYHLWGDLDTVVLLADCALATALAITIAVHYNSIYIILLGALGGYAIPLFSANGIDGFAATFSYLAFLNVALVATTLIRPWNFLKPIGVVATALMFMVWIQGSEYYTWQTEWMLVLHATIFLAGTTLPPLLWKKRSTSADLAALGANSLWLVGATWLLFHKNPDQQMAMVCWGMSALHAMLFAWTYHRVTNVDRMPRVHLALAAVFFTLAVPLQMRDTLNYLAYAWAIEGFVFAAIGVYFRDRQLAGTAIVVLALALIRAIAFDFVAQPAMLGTSGVDRRLLVMLGTGLATMAAGSCFWWVARMAPQRDAPALSPAAGGLLLALGNIVVMLGLTCQWDGRGVLFLWTLDAALLWIAAFRSGSRPAKSYAILVSVLMVGGRLLYHGSRLDGPFLLISNDRFASMALVALLYFIPGWLLSKRKPPTPDATAGADVLLHLLGHAVFFTAVSLEIHSWFATAVGASGSNLRSISTAEQTAYSIAWAIYAALLVAVGFVLQYRLARLLGLLAFLLVASKVFFVDLAALPLIARVMALAALGATLLMTSFWYQKFTARLDSEE